MTIDAETIARVASAQDICRFADAGAIADVAPVLKALNVLHYAPHVQKAVEDKDDAMLAAYEVRLSGALDLYCLA